jgi:hypothetical protein
MRATDKPFNIDKKLVYEAYKAVKSNGGAAGVDGQTIEQFKQEVAGSSPALPTIFQPKTAFLATGGAGERHTSDE